MKNIFRLGVLVEFSVKWPPVGNGISQCITVVPSKWRKGKEEDEVQLQPKKAGGYTLKFIRNAQLREKSIGDCGQTSSLHSVLFLNVIAANLANTTVHWKCAVTVRKDECDNYEWASLWHFRQGAEHRYFAKNHCHTTLLRIGSSFR